jgi:hypothetical protein
VILTYSPTLHAAQTAGFDQTLAKATRALAELAATLARGNTRSAPGRGTDCDRRDHPAPLGRPGPDHRPDR